MENMHMFNGGRYGWKTPQPWFALHGSSATGGVDILYLISQLCVLSVRMVRDDVPAIERS